MAVDVGSGHINADVIGLIMAGGRSERMRAGFGNRHKSLVTILGVTLLERNICALLARGIRRVAVASNASETDIQDYVQQRAPRLAASVGGNVEHLKEEYHLGTIGAAGQLSTYKRASILVANVDNLTTLDWTEMLSYHRRKRAAMTVAAHRQPLRSDFGELTVRDGRVVQYHEKPVRHVLISSGCYVLSSATCRLIASGGRTDVPTVVNRLLHSGRVVAAFEHECPWIDVNDGRSVADAERLVAHHFTDFECWHPAPHDQRVHLLVRRQEKVLAIAVGNKGPGDHWDFPQCAVGEDLNRSARKLCGKIGMRSAVPRLIGAYDDFDERTDLVVRRHIFLSRIEGGITDSLADEYGWISFREHAADPYMSSPMLRAINLLRSFE